MFCTIQARTISPSCDRRPVRLVPLRRVHIKTKPISTTQFHFIIIISTNTHTSRAQTPLVRLSEDPCQNPFVALNRHHPASAAPMKNRDIVVVASATKQPTVDPIEGYEPPKRTVSLGPRRRPAPLPPSRFNTDKEKSFNRMADELQSSLSELSNLIDTSPSPSPTPRIATKPPKYTSYLTSTAIETPLASTTTTTTTTSPSYAHPQSLDNRSLPANSQQNYRRDSSTQQHWNNQESGSKDQNNNNNGIVASGNHDEEECDWRNLSASINDLRSLFEQKLNLAPPSPLPTHNHQRPPLSASPSVLRNSPWANLAASSRVAQQQQQQPTNYSDYTIRRTTSTSGRTSTVRNPYRTFYA